MNILISLPIILSLILFGYLWLKHKKMNVLSLILVVISILIPFFPMIDYNETTLLLAIGMTGGWIISLIGNKEMKEHELSRILKLCLSGVFFFVAISFIIYGPIAEAALWNNYYRKLIVNVAIGVTLIGVVIFLIMRIRKIKSGVKL